VKPFPCSTWFCLLCLLMHLSYHLFFFFNQVTWPRDLAIVLDSALFQTHLCSHSISPHISPALSSQQLNALCTTWSTSLFKPLLCLTWNTAIRSKWPHHLLTVPVPSSFHSSQTYFSNVIWITTPLLQIFNFYPQDNSPNPQNNN
jgi:hypothetical protein